MKGFEDALGRKFPPEMRRYRRHFHLMEQYVGWLLSGRKTTTIRYKPGGIDWPMATELPLISVDDKMPTRQTRVGLVRIAHFTIKTFGELTVDDARADGFSSLKELKVALSRLYGTIGEGDNVTIYNIVLAGPMEYRSQ